MIRNRKEGGETEEKTLPEDRGGHGGSGQTVGGRAESKAPAPSESKASHLMRRDSPILLDSGRTALLSTEDSL